MGGTGIWFLISGGLTIGGAYSGNKCLVVATLVMSVISTLSAGIFTLFSIFILYFILGNDFDDVWTTFIVLEILLGLAMLVVGTATAALTCRPLCCRGPTAGALHYSPATAGQPTILPANLPASLPTGLLPGRRTLPPTPTSPTMAATTRSSEELPGRAPSWPPPSHVEKCHGGHDGDVASILYLYCKYTSLFRTTRTRAAVHRGVRGGVLASLDSTTSLAERG